MKEKVDYRLRIEKSKDGSHTLYHPRFDSYYHSVYGAIQESKHVFIKECLERIDSQHIKIVEIGFGTGLNALLSLAYAIEHDTSIEYHGYEAYPISSYIAEKLNYCQLLGHKNLEALFMQMHLEGWNKSFDLNQMFRITKHEVDVLKADFGSSVDAVFFDAFGPGAQPDLWCRSLFDKLYRSMNTGGVLSTYCCKGDVRRALGSVGFSVEKVPGPPGKREMLVARK